MNNNDKLNFEEKDNLARQKLNKIAIDWFTSDPILLNLYSMFNLKADPQQETIGINILGKHPLITYNPNFVNTISLEYLELILVHTLFKVLLRHCTTRLKEPKQISALASNITIDELIYNNILSFLEKDPSLKKLIPFASNFNLPSKECYEEYFRQLYDKQSKINKMIEKIWKSRAYEEKEEIINQLVNNKQNDYKIYNNEKECIKDYFNPNGTANIGWGINDIFDNDIKNYIEKNKDKIKLYGKYTGNVINEILAVLNSSFSFKDVIHKFKKSIMTYQNENTRLKINRRYDLFYPGHRRKLTTKILFAIDESGSMSDEDLSYGFATINKICKHMEIDYVTFDTEIKQIEKNYKKVKKNFKVFGRGGTDPTCVFNYIIKSKNKYDGCIIFTDGYFDSNIKEPPFKVLWLLHSKNMNVPCNFGYVSTLDRFEK